MISIKIIIKENINKILIKSFINVICA